MRKNLHRAGLVCPDCRTALEPAGEGLRCTSCGATFSVHDSAAELWPPSRRAELEAAVHQFRGAHPGVRQSRFFRALLPPDPVCDPDRRRRERRVRELTSRGLVLNLGSKSARWGEHVINVDLVRPADDSAAVDLLADIQRLPFADASVDGVICTYVLEHVADAQACIDEITRIVRPGGVVYVTVPFIFPTHPDPLDRWRWTLDGLRHAMQRFEEIESGIAGGSFSAIVSITPTAVGSMFSNFYLFNIVRTALGWLMWPLKFLDHIAWQSSRVHMAPANLYFIGRKV